METLDVQLKIKTGSKNTNVDYIYSSKQGDFTFRVLQDGFCKTFELDPKCGVHFLGKGTVEVTSYWSDCVRMVAVWLPEAWPAVQVGLQLSVGGACPRCCLAECCVCMSCLFCVCPHCRMKAALFSPFTSSNWPTAPTPASKNANILSNRPKCWLATWNFAAITWTVT